MGTQTKLVEITISHRMNIHKHCTAVQGGKHTSCASTRHNQEGAAVTIEAGTTEAGTYCTPPSTDIEVPSITTMLDSGM